MTNEQMREFEEWAADYCLTDGPSKQDCFFAWQAATAKANQWRPIADAPARGPILIIAMDAPKPTTMWGCYPATRQYGGSQIGDWYVTANSTMRPTHWQPIPLPPTGTEPQGGE